jgi:hypothetical protein
MSREGNQQPPGQAGIKGLATARITVWVHHVPGLVRLWRLHDFLICTVTDLLRAKPGRVAARGAPARLPHSSPWQRWTRHGQITPPPSSFEHSMATQAGARSMSPGEPTPFCPHQPAMAPGACVPPWGRRAGDPIALAAPQGGGAEVILLAVVVGTFMLYKAPHLASQQAFNTGTSSPHSHSYTVVLSCDPSPPASCRPRLFSQRSWCLPSRPSSMTSPSAPV